MTMLTCYICSFKLGADCSCSSYTDADGDGHCLKPSNNPMCYVNKPSACTDLEEHRGNQFSHKACQQGCFI